MYSLVYLRSYICFWCTYLYADWLSQAFY